MNTRAHIILACSQNLAIAEYNRNNYKKAIELLSTGLVGGKLYFNGGSL
ncbi:MAG: hypothetical protein K8R53_05145 [Bacteroidales bacterium]|nr:hypothetical protein [Bacteroidales bacterium]